jgi:hypothetical protein
MLTNRAIFSRARTALETAGFVYLTRQTSGRRGLCGEVYTKEINGKTKEVILNMKLAKEIVRGL